MASVNKNSKKKYIGAGYKNMVYKGLPCETRTINAISPAPGFILKLDTGHSTTKCLIGHFVTKSSQYNSSYINTLISLDF